MRKPSGASAILVRQPGVTLAIARPTPRCRAYAALDASLPSVATLLSRRAIAGLHHALRRRARVVPATTCAELRDVVRREPVCAVLVEPFDASDASLAPTVEFIRTAYPSIPVLVFCRLDGASVRQILPLARAGIDEIIIDGTDDPVSAIERRLAAAEEHCIAREVLLRLEARIPGTLRSLVAYCLAHASRNLTVDSLAAAFGVDRKTLSRRLMREGWPAPGVLLAWSRVLVVARLIERHERPVDHIALAFDYPSGTALRNALRRHVGLCPHQIRANGGLDCAMRAFVAALSPCGNGHAPPDDSRQATSS